MKALKEPLPFRSEAKSSYKHVLQHIRGRMPMQPSFTVECTVPVFRKTL